MLSTAYVQAEAVARSAAAPGCTPIAALAGEEPAAPFLAGTGELPLTHPGCMA